MSDDSAGATLVRPWSRRVFVRKQSIIVCSTPTLLSSSMTMTTGTSANQSCCGKEEKRRILPPPIKPLPKPIDTILSEPSEILVEVPVQRTVPKAIPKESTPLFYEIMSNAWPSSNKRIDNVTITSKRCKFSNEAISIKPITAIPGIGKKYGQLFADHGFIYARQLLGYYLILKDNEMFRKWLEYKFNIPKFRAAEITGALAELIRRIL